MLLTAREMKLFKCFIVGTIFKHLPHKGTGTEVKKTARQKRAWNRMTAQSVKWQKHTRNRSQCVTKRLAGPHTRKTHQQYPEIRTVKDVRKKYRDDREVVVMLEKMLVYPGDEGYGREDGEGKTSISSLEQLDCSGLKATVWMIYHT
jgi:hypothetical protein